jgi:hypothetical protein
MAGRVGAGTYLLSVSAAVNAWCLVVIGLYYYVIVPNTVSRTYVAYGIWALGVAFGSLFFSLSRRRLQDLNCPGVLANVLAFPLFGIIILPVLCFLSAPRFPNRYGRPPLPSGALKVTAALVSFGVALIIMVPLVAKLYGPLHWRDPF